MTEDKRTALVADDEVAHATVLMRLLGRRGYEATTANSCVGMQTILDEIRAGQREVLDLWLTDNDIDGFDDGVRMTTEQAAAEGGLGAVARRVVLMSGRGLREGVSLPDGVEFMLKPLQIDRLV